MAEMQKLKSAVTMAPIGAVGGGIVGYMVAKKLGYEREISVISFTMVGVILGATIGISIRSK